MRFVDEEADDDDRENYQQIAAKGLIFGRWFSKFLIEGECSTVAAKRLTEITEREFEEARANKFEG